MSKIILDLCGGTGSWSRPYKKAGYDVKVIDPLQNTGDIRELEYIDNVYGILAAPPCTEFAGSGARWWEEKGHIPLMNALSIVDACFRIITVCKPKFWALENPVGRLKNYIGEPRLRFHPWHYGADYTKQTLLWGEFNMPKLTPVFPENADMIHKLPPSKERAKLRSITPEGFAKAFFQANK